MHTWSQARAHAAPSLPPPEIQADPQPRTHRPGAASQRTWPGGRGAGTRPSQVSLSSQAPHHCGPQTPGLGNNPQQTPHDCKLSCRAAFCQLPQQTLPLFAEFALHAHCPAHTHTHVNAVHSRGPVNSSLPLPAPLHPPLPSPSTRLCPPPSAPTPARPPPPSQPCSHPSPPALAAHPPPPPATLEAACRLPPLIPFSAKPVCSESS